MMRMNRFLLIIAAAAALSLSARAQNYGWGVNTHCYEFHPETDTPAPAGYKPVYLSHYGRHGSRTGMNVKDHYERLLGTLEKAMSKKLLTPEGDSLMTEVRQVIAVHDGMEGRLTRVGEAEEHELGSRIYKRYKPVFRGN